MQMAKRGRPPGAKNKKGPTVVVEKTRCPKCQSTDRSEYMGTPNVQLLTTAVLDREGKPYNKVTRRRCKCLNCGQIRFDQIREMTKKTPKSP